MKKILIVFSLGVLVYSCGGSDSGNKPSGDSAGATTSTTPTGGDPSSNPEYIKGLELIANSDCLTCHKAEEKVIGPAYRDVANKYPNNQATIDMLVEKVIAGGQGVWGQVPMSAHPALSKEDATTMVKYVMMLKTN